MDTLTQFMRSDICSHLLTTLIHTLWQAALIAALLYMTLRNIAVKHANTRYLLSLFAIYLLVFSAVVTFAFLLNPLSEFSNIKSQTATESPSLAPNQTSPQTKTDTTPQTTTNNYNDSATKPATSFNWRQWAFIVWFLGVFAMLIRAASTIAGVSKLRSRCSFVDDPQILSTFNKLRNRICPSRTISLLISDRISVPGVIGALKPAILLPASILTSIPADDLHAILAHELAHIRRHDYLINFCQMIIEAVLFFNPAMWWISRCIRTEREASCDAATVLATGQKLTYARALANFAANLHAPNSPTPAIAFGKSDSTNSILDRVKRLLIANHRPNLKISWPTTIIILIATITILIAHQKTTNATINYIGKLLTPKQRIEKIDQIQKQYSSSNYNAPPSVTVNGIVKTEDGKSPKEWQLTSYSGNSTTYVAGTGCGSQDEQDYSFSAKLHPGRAWLHCSSPGYAPSITSLELEPGDQLDGYEITLGHGFTSNIKVTDNTGIPIPNASLSADYQFGNSHRGNAVDSVARSDGIAVIENSVDHPISLDVIAAGFEKIEDKILTLAPDKTYTIILRPSLPTTGIVLDALTNQLLADATIRIVMKEKPGHGWDYGYNAKVVASTDSNGNFTLASLETAATYTILVTAPEHGFAFVENVTNGQHDLQIKLEPATKINGTITGDLSKLDGRYHSENGKRARIPEITVYTTIEMGNQTNSDYDLVPVTVTDGVGHFNIDKVMPGKLEFKIQNKVIQKLELIKGKYEYDVHIDLNADIETETRNVIVTFIQPDSMPAPKGTVQLCGTSPNDKKWKTYKVDIENGTGSVEVPVPIRLSCRMQAYNNNRLVGYWFNMNDRNKLISPSQQPFEFNIPVSPAGSIYGKVTDSDGSTVYDCDISIDVTDLPKGIKFQSDIKSKVMGFNAGKQGTYNAFPLPFGGKYRINARRENYMMASPEIKISGDNPIAQYDFTIADSINLKGRILNHDSTPLANASYALCIKGEKSSHTQITTTKTTDSNGNFLITNVNPDKKFSYQLRVHTFNDGTLSTKKFDLKSTESPQNFKLDYIKTTASIKGSVLDEDTSKPIPGVSVVVKAKDKKEIMYQAKNVTDKNGTFNIPIIESDRYSVAIRADNVDGYNMFYTSKVVDTLDDPVTFIIKPSNSLTGTVIDIDTSKPLPKLAIKGHCKFNKGGYQKGEMFNPVTDANGRFAVKNFNPDIYIIDDIPGYTIIGDPSVTFSKNNRYKQIQVKVKKNN